MINLRVMRTALNVLHDLRKNYVWTMEYDEEKATHYIRCVYNAENMQVILTQRFKDYSSYSPQFLELCEKMDKLVKVIEKDTDK